MTNHTARFSVPARPAAFEAALEGLTRVNERLMSDPSIGGPALPKLYESGVVYRTEPRDVWRHAADVAREGWGDCEDLSAWRAAELRVSGEDPNARVVTYKSGPNRYHAVVARGDGSMEDPSKALGMGAPKMPKFRGKPPKHGVVIGEDPTPDQPGITFEVMKIPGRGWGGAAGWRGVIRMPLGMQVLQPNAAAVPAALVTSGPLASSPAAALSKQIADPKNAIAKIVNALPDSLKAKLPPQAMAAASVLTDPRVVAALKNPASLLNASAALARPDIAVQNVADVASKLKDLKFW